MKAVKALLIYLLLFVLHTQAQEPPFWEEIVAFKKADSVKFPQKNAILFVGSSSFRKWSAMAEAFPGYTVINRGFGGSNLVDVIRYSYDIILPYQPKQVIIYCGDNDLAQGVSATEVIKRVKTLYQIIRLNLPSAVIDFVSIKPSPLRQKLLTKMKVVNREVERFLKKEKNAGFINVYSHMVDAKENPKEELFIEDKLHLNEKGYALWKKIILPYLSKN
jgi:lysophospholipase L1-like esterase